MREILFRAKTIENNQWVEGYFVYVPCSRFLCEEWLIQTIKEDGRIGQLHTVYESTVGQFTGLTDKNGKKIFEGDIVDCWSEGVNAKGAVQQNRGGLWIIYPAWQKHIMWGLCPNEDGSTDVEIIGNIHDNPELIERWRL